MKGILQDLASRDLHKRRESLQSLHTLAKMHSSSLPLPHLAELTQELAECLYDADREISGLTLAVLQDLLNVRDMQKSTEDLELEKANLFAALLYKTTDPRFSSIAQSCILSYSKFSRSPSVVLSEIYFQGFCHENVTHTQAQIREQAVTLVVPVIKAFPGLGYDEEEMSAVVKHLAERLADDDGRVVLAAAQQLRLCRDAIPVFQETLQRLPGDLRRRCEGPLQAELQSPADPAVPTSAPQDQWPHLPLDAMKTFSDSFSSGIDFGFLPSRVLPRLKDKENWKDRVAALSEVETCLKSLDSLAPVIPYLPTFLSLLCELIMDKNLKVCTAGLALVEYILTFVGVSLHADLVPVATSCIQKLGDNKIMIRQATFRCLRKLIKEVRLGKLLPHLLDRLKDSNWHMREEVLNVILACMLTPDQVHDVDFLELIPAITPLIDDEKPKVRYVAQETLSVLSHVCGKDRVVHELKPLLDDFTMESLQDKFNRKSVPIVRDDCIEFPRVVPASAPQHHVALHSPIPSIFQPLDEPKQYDFNQLGPDEVQSAPVGLLHKRRLRSAVKREKEEELFPPNPDAQPPDSSESQQTASTRASRFSSLRISKRKVVRKPNFSEQVVEAMAEPASAVGLPLAEDLTPYSPSKPKESLRVMATQTPVKAMQEVPAQAETPIYIRSEDLPVPLAPHEDFQRMLKGLQTTEWAGQFEALNVCRALLKHCPDFFRCVNFHEIVFQVLMLADSLRSSLSKNALMALGDMCQYVNRNVEPDLDTVAALLLRKAVDTNIFLSESALKSAMQMCQFCSEGKVVSALLANLSGTRSSLVKAKSAYCFEKIFLRLDAKVGRLKELDRVLKKLSEFSTEASPEVRGCAKGALRTLGTCLQGSGELDKLLFRCLSSEEYKQVKTFMTQSVSLRIGRGVRFRNQSSLGDPLKASMIRRSSQSPGPVDDDLAERLRQAAEKMTESNWQVRCEAIAQVAELVTERKDLRRSGKMVIAVDSLGKGLTDKNVNVVFKALDAAKSIVTGDSREALVPHCNLLVHALVGTLGSGNASIRAGGRQLLTAMLTQWEPSVLVPSMVSVLPKATDRAKFAIFEELIALAPRVNSSKPALLMKQIVPAAKLLMDEHKSDFRQLSNRLSKVLYDLLGAELINCMNQEQLPKLMAALDGGE